MSCESYLYDDYKIIDYKRKVNRDYTLKNNLYKVRKGDNLFSISRRFNISIQELIKVNKIQEPYKIFPNQSIFHSSKSNAYSCQRRNSLFHIKVL